MKKAKILALILVASLMLTGGAYALWNQSIHLTTSASMGKMDVGFTCDKCIYPLTLLPGIAGGSYGYGYSHTYGDFENYMNPMTGTVSADKQTLTVTVGKMYPGAKYGLNFTIENTGDVPFKLQGVTITRTDGNADLFAKLKGSFTFKYQDANGVMQQRTVASSALTSAGLGAAIVTACSDIVVYPGAQIIGFANQDDVTTIMQVSVDDTISGDQFETDSATFTVDFNWQQCTPVPVA